MFDILFIVIYNCAASKKYKKFRLFLGNEIEIVQTNKPEIKVAGKLLCLGKDYFILSKAYEKKIFCVFCNDNDVAVRRIN